MRQALRQEDGAGTIIEYTIVFPIVLVVFGMLLIGGFGVYQRGVLEGAVERQAIYTAREMAVPNYGNVVSFGQGDRAGVSNVAFGDNAGVGETGISVAPSAIENNPYESLTQLFGGGDVGAGNTTLASAIDEGTLDLAEHLFTTTGEPSVVIQGTFFHSALATAQQDLIVPLDYSWFPLPAFLEIPVSAEYPALDSEELIRNLQMVSDYYRASGAEGWVEGRFNALLEAIGVVEGEG
ncbi:MAG: hypothetical protein LBS27_10990 [Bifidobacteriaceae bacterium]|jgi:hypothetical protein|nr:hypothetical protein [Bifidobacteriaceae bacterium]